MIFVLVLLPNTHVVGIYLYFTNSFFPPTLEVFIRSLDKFEYYKKGIKLGLRSLTSEAAPAQNSPGALSNCSFSTCHGLVLQRRKRFSLHLEIKN